MGQARTHVLFQGMFGGWQIVSEWKNELKVGPVSRGLIFHRARRCVLARAVVVHVSLTVLGYAPHASRKMKGSVKADMDKNNKESRKEI